MATEPKRPERPERRLANPKAVAHAMSVSQRAVTEWARQGRLKSRRTPGGHYRIEVDEDGWPVETGEQQ